MMCDPADDVCNSEFSDCHFGGQATISADGSVVCCFLVTHEVSAAHNCSYVKCTMTHLLGYLVIGHFDIAGECGDCNNALFPCE